VGHKCTLPGATKRAPTSGFSWFWGPFGTSVHAHRDKLQVQLHARGAVLLADSGRVAYAGTDRSAVLHREYARNTSAHNTLCLHADGGAAAAGGGAAGAGPGWCNQQAAPAQADAPVGNDRWAFTPAADWVTGAQPLWEGVAAGGAAHTRSLLYTRGRFAVGPDGRFTDAGSGGDGDWLVVVDAVTTRRARRVTYIAPEQLGEERAIDIHDIVRATHQHYAEPHKSRAAEQQHDDDDGPGWGREYDSD
jgi:hypothetical protein